MKNLKILRNRVKHYKKCLEILKILKKIGFWDQSPKAAQAVDPRSIYVCSSLLPLKIKRIRAQLDTAWRNMYSVTWKAHTLFKTPATQHNCLQEGRNLGRPRERPTTLHKFPNTLCVNRSVTKIVLSCAMNSLLNLLLD